jgi:hypothetical protein
MRSSSLTHRTRWARAACWVALHDSRRAMRLLRGASCLLCSLLSSIPPGWRDRVQSLVAAAAARPRAASTCTRRRRLSTGAAAAQAPHCAAPAAPTTNQVLIELAYLKSYSGMGAAVLRCLSGCQCQETRIDGHHEARNSQVWLQLAQPVQSGCRTSPRHLPACCRCRPTCMASS